MTPAGLLLAAFALMLPSPAAFAAPNIVVVLTDDQDSTSIAYMPKVHRLLAEEGITFSNSFVDYSLCAPSRASLLTGQAAHNHGIRSNSPGDTSAWESFWPKEGSALPVWLQKAGYRTALLGKYINGYGKKRKSERLSAAKAKGSQSLFGRWTASLFGGLREGSQPTGLDWVPEGWDLWYAFAGGVGYYSYSINENGAIRRFGESPQDYSTDVLKERALRFIKDQAGTGHPFFMLISTKAVHGKGQEGEDEHAAIPSPRYKNAFKDVALPVNPVPDHLLAAGRSSGLSDDTLERKYRATLETLQSVDDLVEAVVGELESADMLEDTVIVYTSDNGFLFGEHGRVGKRSLFEGSIRVPLIVRGPGIPVNTTRDQLVNNLDVVATVEELAGLRPALVPDGRSLRPLFGDAGSKWRSTLLLEKGSEFGLRTATRKYIRDNDGAEQLYDLVNDPQELKNKANDPGFAAERASLRATLDRLQSCVGSACWVP
jgi:arylsulfatase A-like enzyme